MSTVLATRPEFAAIIPASLKIKAGSNQTILTTKLQSSTITVERDATTTIIALLTESDDQHHKINFQFPESGASATVLIFAIGAEETKFSFETISNHHAPHTNAFYYIRSTLFDKAQINYRGNLVIKKAAQHTDSYLAHNSLMLSPKAKTDTEPCLEIEADDVSAGHAAGVGRVDESLLFYLQSRGLSKKEAQKILITGFMEADLSKIEDEELRQLLAKTIEEILEKYDA